MTDFDGTGARCHERRDLPRPVCFLTVGESKAATADSWRRTKVTLRIGPHPKQRCRGVQDLEPDGINVMKPALVG
jgi:hypothetical protein